MTASVGTKSTYAIDPLILSKIIHVSPSITEKTLNATTVLASKLYLESSYSSYGNRFGYLTRRHLKGRFFIDTFFGKESLEWFKAAQLFINEFRYTHLVLMKSKEEAHSALRNFFDNVGLPDLIISDNSCEQGASVYGSQTWKGTLREFGVAHRLIEPYKYHQSYAENSIKMLKFMTVKVMERQSVPSKLWDNCIEYCANLCNRIAHKVPRLEGRTPYEIVHGVTPDISAFITFGFYDYCWYIVSPKPLFPDVKRKIGRWLGPSKAVICDLIYKILTKSGQVIHSSAVEPISKEELKMDSIMALIREFDIEVAEKIGPSMVVDDIREMLEIEGDAPELEYAKVSVVRVHENVKSDNYEEDEGPRNVDGDDQRIVVASVETPSSQNAIGWESARVKLPRVDGFREGIVRKKKRDHNGDIIGTSQSNPILDTTVYMVKMDDGMMEEVSANVIAQAIYEQSDDNGYDKNGLVLDVIIDHFVSQKLTKKKTTKGWYLLVRWKNNGGESVVRLQDLKESYPVQVAEYAIENSLGNEDAFCG